MVAKPIIDISAIVEDLDDTNDLLPILEDHGYEQRPDEVRGRLFLVKWPRTTEHTTSHLQRRKATFTEGSSPLGIMCAITLKRPNSTPH